MTAAELQLPLSFDELETAASGVPADIEAADLVVPSVELDGTIAEDLAALQQLGLDWPEALTARMVWVRMYLAKLDQLKEAFEAKRH